MGPAGRDRRVRSRIGKRRTPGQRAEDSDSEQPGEPASGSAGPVVVVDEEVEECQDEQPGASVEYTRREQVSPTRKRV